MDTTTSEWNYMLVTRTNENTVEHFPCMGCHNAKSIGGSAFHEENMKSVLVYDHAGTVYLYLVAGHPEKTVDVKSPC